MLRGLEGCFAQGHVYVLISRVTDPATQRITTIIHTVIRYSKHNLSALADKRTRAAYVQAGKSGSRRASSLGPVGSLGGSASGGSFGCRRGLPTGCVVQQRVLVPSGPADSSQNRLHKQSIENHP